MPRPRTVSRVERLAEGAPLRAVIADDVNAHVVEDVLPTGAWLFGLLRKALGLEPSTNNSAAGSTDADNVILVTCEDCSQTLAFPVEQLGAVEVCRHCGGIVDVGYDDQDDEDWGVDESDDLDTTWDD